MSNCWSIKLLETKNFEVLKCSVEIIFIGSKLLEDQHFLNDQTLGKGKKFHDLKKNISQILCAQNF